MTGGDSQANGAGQADRANHARQLQDEVWARRAEWLPAHAAREAMDATSADQAMARVREVVRAFADNDVFEFIQRARAARG
jgi:hypothetical protein